MSNPIPFPAPSTAPRWLVGLGLVALAAWSVFIFRHSTAIAAGSDSSGYLNSARLFAKGELMTTQRLPPELGPDVSPVHFIPLGFWMASEPGKIVPTYPPGLPLHFAATSFAVGWRLGPMNVVVGAAALALLLLYLSARELGISALIAMAGTAAFALSPLYFFSSVQPLSDTVAATWCIAAVWLALRARRGGLGWAWACGLSFGIAVLVRPSNALLAPCLCLLLVHWRRLAVAAIGGIPVAIWLGWYNRMLYGSPFRTGYGDVGESLAASYFVPTSLHIGLWLSRLLPAIFLLLPFAMAVRWRHHRFALLVLGTWWICFFVFYSCYNVTHETWWCLRFILPAIPALILAALLGLESCGDRFVAQLPRPLHWRPWAAAILLLWSGAVFNYWSPRLGLFDFGAQEIAYREASLWARSNLPPDAIIATMPASGSLYYYTGFPVLRWDLMNPEDFKQYAETFRSAGRPVFAMIFQGEEQRALRERMPDKWEKVTDVAGIALWKLSAAP